MNFMYVSDTFYFKSWNLFVALCALPSIMLGLWLFAFPESPKFLLECGETEAALEVFKWIYAQNTGQDPDTYPVNPLTFRVSPIAEINYFTLERNCYEYSTILALKIFICLFPFEGEDVARENEGQEHEVVEAAQTKGPEGTFEGSTRSNDRSL